MQAYSDPKREDDPHALPDIEVWQDKVSTVVCTCGEYDVPYDTAHAEAQAYCPSCNREAIRVKDRKRSAWWWWSCFPGCLPEGDGTPNGPFKSERAALADAREGMEE